jgi:oligopeptide transport system ATP-binding protein
MDERQRLQRTDEDILLKLIDIKKNFPIYGGILRKIIGHVKAVDGVSFKIQRGKTFGLVGESGCGKTTLSKCVIRLIEPTSGEIIFDDVNITNLKAEELRLWRKNAQIVFQDPFSSLDPRQKAGQIIGEPLSVQGILRGAELEEKVKDLLQIVSLSASDFDRYPHEFSGGQRQRIGIARALALRPKLVVCDEPVSALDVSIQSQILNLLKQLQEEFGLTYIFVAHGLPVIKYMSDRIGVMYLGKIVELASNDSLFKHPLHPYTQALLSAIPIPDPDIRSEIITLEGDVPSPANPPSGCRFHTRCMYQKDICKIEEPPLEDVGEEHFVACHFPGY